MEITKKMINTEHESIREAIRLTAEKIDSREMVDKALKKGDKIPSFKLENTEGDMISSEELIKEGPLIMIFSPGNLSLNSTLELQSYQEALPEIHKLGANLVIISHDSKENIKDIIEENSLEYDILIDDNNEVAKKFNLIAPIDKKLSDVYNNMGIDLMRDENNNLVLPLPATYVISTDRSVVLSYIDLDYTNRLSPEEALDGLRNRS